MNCRNKRLNVELKNLEKNKIDGIIVKPKSDNNLYEWDAIIVGPKNSPFEDGKFKLTINFGSNYPYSAPSVVFNTQMWHPNISSSGSICISVLSSDWSPTLSVQQLLLSICSLLTDPNPKDPYNSTAAKEYLEENDKYNERVKEYIKKHAT